ncbi:hypothetical protein A9Q81_20495 [Gammaproteobacteria bacterium 42_54_T18]|nr:hypothetical protein A9Q81_20495 [Gammaproteobacteria bacterium 42_54_T18]
MSSNSKVSKVAPHNSFQAKVCHRIGNHCGSTAIRDILEFHGMPMSEAMCFGLGGGLGVTYLRSPFEGLPYIVHVRSMGFEPRVFENLGIAFAWQEFEKEENATTALRNQLNKGKPALLLTNIRHLPYYGTDTDFPGHAIVAWQFDEASESVYVTDTEREALIKVPETSLIAARYSTLPPFIHLGNMFSPDTLEKGLDLPSAVRRAIMENSYRMLTEPDDGLASLECWEKEIDQWCQHKSGQWTLRFAYQVIEKRGTGGGGFRKMYGDFLEESSEFLPEISEWRLVNLMRDASEKWSEFALALKQESENNSPNAVRLRSCIHKIIVSEKRYLESTQKAFPDE